MKYQRKQRWIPGCALAAAAVLTALPATVLAGDCQPQWDAPECPLDVHGRMTTTAIAFDDGSGEALYLGGQFGRIGDVEAANIARWDGANWSSLGGGVGGRPPSHTGVNAMAVFDDGGGPALYVGGNFVTAGGIEVNRIARWDGQAWSALGSGMNGSVDALYVHDDGTGPALYAGGTFTTAGGNPAVHIAKWDGQQWSPLGSGIQQGFQTGVMALNTYTIGGNDVLVVGGNFESAGGIASKGVAYWNGHSWASFGSITGLGWVAALQVYEGKLIIGGAFTQIGPVTTKSIVSYDGGTWSALSTGMEYSPSFDGVGAVWNLAVFDDGTGVSLFASGIFDKAGTTSANKIARWNGGTWRALGQGITGYSTHAAGLYPYHDESGNAALYVLGYLHTVDGNQVQNLARWIACNADRNDSRTR